MSRLSPAHRPARYDWMTLAVAAMIAGSLQLGRTLLTDSAPAPLTAQTTTGGDLQTAARSAIETISACDATMPVTGDVQPLHLFERAIYTLWAQILTSTTPEQGIANTAILGQVFCRQEQTFSASISPDLLQQMHETHVSIVSFLASWHVQPAAEARRTSLQLLRAQLDAERQIITSIRSHMP